MRVGGIYNIKNYFRGIFKQEERVNIVWGGRDIIRPCWFRVNEY